MLLSAREFQTRIYRNQVPLRDGDIWWIAGYSNSKLATRPQKNLLPTQAIVVPRQSDTRDWHQHVADIIPLKPNGTPDVKKTIRVALDDRTEYWISDSKDEIVTKYQELVEEVSQRVKAKITDYNNMLIRMDELKTQATL
jgi:hypothetical protein